MERDSQFEIQFLISLIVAVLGSISADAISQYISGFAAHLLLFLIFTHIVLFIVEYTVRNAGEFELEESIRLGKITELTLILITFFFTYLLAATLSVWALIEIIPLAPADSVPKVRIITYRMVFGVFIPFIAVGAMGVHLWRKIWPSVQDARDIDIAIVPKDISVFHTFESTRPLHLNIDNETGEEINFHTEIEFPNQVEWKHGYSEGAGRFKDESVVPGDGHEPYDFELRYQGEDRRTEEVEIVIRKDGDIYRDDIVLTLETF